MNQSRHGIQNLVFYKESNDAEGYNTLMARCDHVRKQLNQIYSDGYVTRPSGTRVYIKFGLTADKSGLCHLLGRRNMNYDEFGTCCDCADSRDELYDLTKPWLTHYDALTYEIRCGRAHIARHEALDLPEPPDWTVHCSCCERVRAPPRCVCRAR